MIHEILGDLQVKHNDEMNGLISHYFSFTAQLLCLLDTHNVIVWPQASDVLSTCIVGVCVEYTVCIALFS